MTFPQDSGAPDGSAGLLPLVEPDFPTLLFGEKPPIVLHGGSGTGPGPGDPGDFGGGGDGPGDRDGGLHSSRRHHVPVWRRGWFLAIAGLGVGFCAGAGTVYATGVPGTGAARAGAPRLPTPTPSASGLPSPRTGAAGGTQPGATRAGDTVRAPAGSGNAGTGNAGAAPSAGPARGGRIVGTGVFLVGKEVAPGTYRTSGGATCYWARLRTTDGTLDSIIANGVPSAQAVVTIKSSDKAFDTANCGVWEKVG